MASAQEVDLPITALAYAASSTITVGNAAHWAGSAPTTIQAAIDRLAAQVYALGGNTAIP